LYFDFGSVGQIDIFEEIENSAPEAGTDSARLGFGAARFDFCAGTGSARCSARFIERFVGQRIGFAILFAVNVIDAEGFERL
jgi:hypothetical protein